MLCSPAVVENHLSAHEQTSGHAVVGRVLTDPSFRQTPLERWFDSKNPSSHVGTLPPTCFITQNLSIPASLLSDMGGFDERFSAYGLEDIELGLRLSRCGQCHYDCIKAFSETDFTEDLKQITVPVLVMHGDDDQVVPIADSALLRIKLLKNGILKVYKGFPHGMSTTHADTINADLLTFIES